MCFTNNLTSPSFLKTNTVFLTQYGGIEINQGHEVVDLQARRQPGPHDEQGNTGTAFEHGHLVELPVLHGELSVVSGKNQDGVVEQAGLSQS